MKSKKTVIISFRYCSDKKDFLVKAYAEKLPELLRCAADELVRSAKNTKYYSKHENQK